jgi:hypothetical protein
MNDYSLIQTVFGGIYASDLGRSEAEAEALLREALQNEKYKNELAVVVEEAFSDPNFSWKEALEEYEVYPADDEEEARDYAKKVLWDVIFPGKKLPAAK